MGKILKVNRETIMEDAFIREHIEDLLRNIRTQVLIKLIKPYTRIQIKFISGELNIESGDVESLLVSCILDNTISGRIDQVSGVLELDQSSEGSARYVALDKEQPIEQLAEACCQQDGMRTTMPRCDLKSAL